ncbi:MAG: LbtU family siderophore porin [Nanoarchaeota archaeon]|nr:LbtU family siderophore porin [Nanoarchaeota archaeon]
MLERLLGCFLFLTAAVVLVSDPGLSQEMTKEDIIKELNELKERTRRLEQALKVLEEGEIPTKKGAKEKIQHGGVKGIRERMVALKRPVDGIEFGGAIEVEASYERFRPEKGESESSSDLTVGTVEFAVDASITDRLRAHVLFEYEDGGAVVVDEAIIHFQAEEVCIPDLSCKSPWYANVGKLNVPFGYFESHFISDPLTKELGDTKETAVIVGVHHSLMNVAAGVFNGDVDKAGNDDHVESYLAAGMFTLPEEIVPNLSLMAGVSYISNIADSDGLTDFLYEEFGMDTIEAYVGGLSAFLSFSFEDRYFFETEYVGASEAFKENRNFEPKAWNFEFAFRPVEDFEIAIGYGVSKDALNFLPEMQIGSVAIYKIFENTSISLEYIYRVFENDDEVTKLTTQLAVEF